MFLHGDESSLYFEEYSNVLDLHLEFWMESTVNFLQV